jgi:hypothetical protein
MTGNNLAQSLPGIVSLGPNPELPTTPANPTTTAWFKTSAGVFTEYAFDRGEFEAAMSDQSWVTGVPTGRIRVNLSDAERVEE